jgi:hypothetical protein
VFAAAGCTGAATVTPTQAGSVCASGGRMYAADFAAAAAAVPFQSAEVARWNPATLAFVTECSDVPGTTPPFTLPAVDVGPLAPAPGRVHVVAAD